MSAMFIVQSFSNGKRGRITADNPVQAQSRDHARRMAERLADRKPIVVAFMREGNPKTGDWEEPKLIEAFGDVPDEVLEMERV